MGHAEEGPKQGKESDRDGMEARRCRQAAAQLHRAPATRRLGAGLGEAEGVLRIRGGARRRTTKDADELAPGRGGHGGACSCSP